MSIILFVGGGSLGHIVPSIAVWEALQEERSNLQAHFVCSPSTLDTEFLEKQQLPFSTIDAPRLGFSFLWKFWPAAKHAKEIIHYTKPDLVFSKGGYVSVPVCYAAKKAGIPIVLHESDAVMGRANRIIKDLANKTCYGNPVRKRMMEGSKKTGYAITGFSDAKPVLLVIGGSQGARDLNKAVIQQLDSLLETYQIIHITGHGKQEAVTKPGYFAVEFADEELPHMYAIANVAISRAGAGVTAELAANCIPSILVPLRGVGHDHQQKNAEALSQSSLFTVLQQSELSSKLTPTVEKMSNINDQSASTQKLAKNDAAEIAKMVLEVLDSHQRPH